VQPRTRNSTNNIGIGMPISQSNIHPAAPRSLWSIAILHCMWVYGVREREQEDARPPDVLLLLLLSGGLPRRGCVGLHPCLFCVGNILGPSLLKDLLGTVPLGTIFRMDGNQQVAFLDFTLVPLGLIFRNP